MNILIIKPDHLGDFALALPTLWELNQKIGDQDRMDVLVSPPNAEWSTILDWLPNLIPIRHPRYLRPRKKFAPLESVKILISTVSLQKNNYHYGIELTSSANDFLDKFIFIAANARWSSGPDGAYSFLLNETHSLEMDHQTKILAQRCPQKLKIKGEAKPSEFMPQDLCWKGKDSGEYILFSPWAGTTAKEWSYWSKLAARLSNWKVLAPPDRITEARNLCNGRDEQLAFTRSIRETLECLCKAKFVVTVDSAVSHFAWLTGTPSLTIFSGTTEPKRWATLAEGPCIAKFPSCHPCHLENCNQARHHCMQDISAEDVLNTINTL